MLTNPSERVLSALASLRNEADWQEVIGWFRENTKTLMTRLTEVRDEIEVRQMQGAAQTLMKILELDEQSLEVMYRLQGKKKQ
jgi:predicted ATP-binding protein involved in virulence